MQQSLNVALYLFAELRTLWRLMYILVARSSSIGIQLSSFVSLSVVAVYESMPRPSLCKEDFEFHVS
jgi:hypothetical protein